MFYYLNLSTADGRGRTENECLGGCSCSDIDALCVFHSPVLYLKEMSE